MEKATAETIVIEQLRISSRNRMMNVWYAAYLGFYQSAPCGLNTMYTGSRSCWFATYYAGDIIDMSFCIVQEDKDVRR